VARETAIETVVVSRTASARRTNNDCDYDARDIRQRAVTIRVIQAQNSTQPSTLFRFAAAGADECTPCKMILNLRMPFRLRSLAREQSSKLNTECFVNGKCAARHVPTADSQLGSRLGDPQLETQCRDFLPLSRWPSQVRSRWVSAQLSLHVGRTARTMSVGVRGRTWAARGTRLRAAARGVLLRLAAPETTAPAVALLRASIAPPAPSNATGCA
jgi:hypothetical protein